MREPFPLQWPDGWQRTPASERQRSRFGHAGQVGFSQARRDLLLELERLGAANVVLTTDLPVRADGLPYAASGRVDDPGVAVWFVLANQRGDHEERVFACDKWRTHAENMRSIALSIEALRGLERWGATDVVNRAFAGFTALPPGSGEEDAPPAPKKRPWREILGGAWPAELGRAELLVIARARHRELIRKHHPDAGGDTAKAAELNVAIAEAEKELAGG